MSKAADFSEPASELEHLMADLAGLGPLVFVFGDDFAVTHLLGAITPVFGGTADERWWYVEVGADAGRWTIHVRVDQITGVRFERGPYLFPSFPGQEGIQGLQFTVVRHGHRGTGAGSVQLDHAKYVPKSA